MDFANGYIKAEKDGAIGWLTFNRPERRNAVNAAMWQEIPAALAHLVNDQAIRTVVVRGAGDQAFVSGADISEFNEQRCDSKTNHAFTEWVTAATTALMDCPKPVIAMIQGYCIGGGIVISSACDFRFATPDSKFGVPAGKLGLGYERDNFQRLERIVGSGLALEMLATARLLDANEALQARFINRITEADKIESEIRETAKLIARNAPMTLAAAKASHRAGQGALTPDQAQAAIDACFDSNDFKEGRAAFADKRAPKFAGN